MKNRTGKTIITLLAVIALLTGIMSFENRKVEAATTQIVWEKDDVKNVYVDTRKSDHLSYSKDGITIAAEAESNGQRCLFHDRLIDITSGKIVFSCDSSKGRISQLEIICGEAKNFARDDESWSSSYSEGETHLVWKGQGNPEIVFHPSEYDEDPYMLNIQYVEKMIFTLVSEDTEYPLWVGSRQVTSAYLSNEEEGWSYDPDSKTLTLDNANITDTHNAYSRTSCISTNQDLTISLSGNNMVGSIDSSFLAIDIYDAALTITGSGSLSANSKKLSIFAAGKLIIDNTSVTVNGYITVGSLFDILNGSEVKVTSASGSISVLGPLTVKDSRLEATGDELVVFAEDISISGNSEVKAVAASQAQRVITAIFATDSFEINGLEIVTPEDGKIIKSDADAGIGKEVFTVCDKDGNVAKEVLIKSVTPEYTVTSGAGGTYTLDSGKDYTLAVKRNVNDGSCFERFAGVKLDGKELTKDTDYTAVKGSTVVTIKESTLSKLSEGEHTIAVSFIDGKAETSLTVKKASAPTPEPEPTPATPYRLPVTGVE
jgi:hypothetical protein